MIGPVRQLQRAAQEYDHLFGRGASAREARIVIAATVGFFVLATGAALAIGG